VSTDKELDLGPIEQNLADVNGFPRGIGGVVDVLFDNQEKLIAEVKRLREDRANCIKGLKELKDNALIAMRSYPMHSEGWFDFSRRAQAYENAYIRATNMLNWNGSGKSFVHFKEE
jgi:hypothetical protein